MWSRSQLGAAGLHANCQVLEVLVNLYPQEALLAGDSRALDSPLGVNCPP